MVTIINVNIDYRTHMAVDFQMLCWLVIQLLYIIYICDIFIATFSPTHFNHVLNKTLQTNCVFFFLKVKLLIKPHQLARNYCTKFIRSAATNYRSDNFFLKFETELLHSLSFETRLQKPGIWQTRAEGSSNVLGFIYYL